MLLKYDIYVANEVVSAELRKVVNQIYKLLPMREEGQDWQKPLESILEQLSGLNRLYILQQNYFFLLITKLEGLFTLTDKEEFGLYRRTIFDCLRLLNELKGAL